MKFLQMVAACSCVVLLTAGCTESSSSEDGTSPTQQPSVEADSLPPLEVVDEEQDPLDNEPPEIADPTLELADGEFDAFNDPLVSVCTSLAFGEDAPIGVASASELRDLASSESIEIQNLVEDCLSAG